MKNQGYRFFDSLSCGISQDRGDLAMFGMVARHIPVACGAKLAQRIDARPLPSQGLNANVLRFRRGMKKLALFGNVLDVGPQMEKVEQIVDVNRSNAIETPIKFTAMTR